MAVEFLSLLRIPFPLTAFAHPPISRLTIAALTCKARNQILQAAFNQRNNN